MNYRKVTLAAALTLGILVSNNVVNASQLAGESGLQSKTDLNLLCDMGPTGYAASMPRPKAKKYKPQKRMTGAACPVECKRPYKPYTQPCQPCAPSSTGQAAPCPVQTQKSCQ